MGKKNLNTVFIKLRKKIVIGEFLQKTLENYPALKSTLIIYLIMDNFKSATFFFSMPT